ncbi:unnamed protein product [Clavelina lepadiformis]|uniref:PH domain-containing protein n=2 Tax=Clavelina lepadiformis TaxID=159417 RepID=A0ABP0F758_CLALP
MSYSYPAPMSACSSAAMLKSDPDLRKCGWMKKKSNRQKLLSSNYEERFFIILKGWVYYYKEDSSLAPQKYFSLEGYSNRVIEAEEEKTSSLQNVFKIYPCNNDGRTYFFAIEQKKDLKDWMNSFKQEIEKYNISKVSTLRSSVSCPDKISPQVHSNTNSGPRSQSVNNHHREVGKNSLESSQSTSTNSILSDEGGQPWYEPYHMNRTGDISLPSYSSPPGKVLNSPGFSDDYPYPQVPPPLPKNLPEDDSSHYYEKITDDPVHPFVDHVPGKVAAFRQHSFPVEPPPPPPSDFNLDDENYEVPVHHSPGGDLRNRLLSTAEPISSQQDMPPPLLPKPQSMSASCGGDDGSMSIDYYIDVNQPEYDNPEDDYDDTNEVQHSMHRIPIPIPDEADPTSRFTYPPTPPDKPKPPQPGMKPNPMFPGSPLDLRKNLKPVSNTSPKAKVNSPQNYSPTSPMTPTTPLDAVNRPRVTTTAGTPQIPKGFPFNENSVASTVKSQKSHSVSTPPQILTLTGFPSLKPVTPSSALKPSTSSTSKPKTALKPPPLTSKPPKPSPTSKPTLVGLKPTAPVPDHKPSLFSSPEYTTHISPEKLKPHNKSSPFPPSTFNAQDIKFPNKQMPPLSPGKPRTENLTTTASTPKSPLLGLKTSRPMPPFTTTEMGKTTTMKPSEIKKANATTAVTTPVKVSNNADDPAGKSVLDKAKMFANTKVPPVKIDKPKATARPQAYSKPTLAAKPAFASKPNYIR